MDMISSQTLVQDTVQHENQPVIDQANAVNELIQSKKRLDALEQLLTKTGQLTDHISEMLCQSRERAIQDSANLRKKRKQDVSDPELATNPRGRSRRKKLASVETPVCPLEDDQIQAGQATYENLFQGQLKPYQVEGVEWLYTLFMNGLNGILADEMGLGKTVQTIAWLCRIRSTPSIPWGVNLIVVPLSTLANWETEFARFAPDINVVLYHGVREERTLLKAKIKQLVMKSHNAYKKTNPKSNYTNEQILKDRLGAPVIITSYEMILNKFDAAFFRSFSFTSAVIDEGHRLKNSKSILVHMLSLLTINTRYLLTGTPLQNSLAELWSLLHFVMPLIFNDVDSFLGWFDFQLEGSKLNRTKIMNAQVTNGLVTKMHSILSPFMLRRIKDDVNLSLPPKKELVVVAPMTREQHDLFRTLKQKAYDEYFPALFESHNMPKPKSTRTMINVNMALRRLCCHPFLFPHPKFPLEYEYEPSLLSRSGKMILLDQLLHELLVTEADQKHKVLIFSQFTDVLTIIQYYIEHRQWKHTRLDGNSSHLDRKQAISEFHNDLECRVFLLTTRAGGLGLNLTTADTVILFDSDYNPQNDLQAMDRAHRLGQRRPVTVFRFLSELEWRVYDRAQEKRRLEKMVIGQGQLHDKYGSPIATPELSSNTASSATPQHRDLSPVRAEQAALAFAQRLEALLSEEDGETIRVLEDGEIAIKPEHLKELLMKRATWHGVTESTELKTDCAE